MSGTELQPHTYVNEPIKVCIRLRPILPPAENDIAWKVENNGQSVVSINATDVDVNDSNSVANSLKLNFIGPNIRERELKRRFNEITQQQEFHFNQCYGPSAGTPLIYHEVVKPIMKKTLNGFNGSIFMYGQTTSGKTYTMLGSESSPGVLPCAIRDIFKGVELVSRNSNLTDTCSKPRPSRPSSTSGCHTLRFIMRQSTTSSIKTTKTSKSSATRTSAPTLWD